MKLSSINIFQKLLSPKELSIIIPVYNASRYLSDCLNSIFSQINLNHEVIVIDDASTDDSHIILYDYKKKFENLRLIKNSRNLGPGASRNLGIRCSRGKYIAFIDSDDFVSPDYFKQLVECAEAKQSDIVFSNIEPDHPVFTRFINKYAYSNKDLDCLPADNKLTGIIGKLYRRDFLNENNLKFYGGHILIGEDIPFTWTGYFCAQNISFALDACYHYRLHDSGSDSITDKRVFGIFEALKFTQGIYERLDPLHKRKELLVDLISNHIFYNFSKLSALDEGDPLRKNFTSMAKELINFSQSEIKDNDFLTPEHKNFILDLAFD